MTGRVPHFRIVVAFCAVAVAIYAAFSVYVVAYLKDPALTGDVIGTWKSFAVGAFAFWIGASSGGKARDGELAAGNWASGPMATGKPDDPLNVQPAPPGHPGDAL